MILGKVEKQTLHNLTSLTGIEQQTQEAHLLIGVPFAYHKAMNEFYTSAKWQAKRKAILRRDKYMCQECRRYGRMREAKVVHHIKHYDEYPELGLVNTNLISLCASCHNKAHGEKGTKSKRSGY